jgi:hypothetical protein
VGVGALCDAVAVAPNCPDAFGRATFSNFNYTVDVMAPGVNIVSTLPLPVHEREVAPGYGFKDGTSMAAPYVTGTAALVYASHPGITPYQVTRILETTSSAAVAGRARSSTFGWGAVNPLAAAQAQAPVDDLGEPNDDIHWLPKRDTLRPGRVPIRLTARMDANDDPLDNFAVLLRKGERMRVTITAAKAAIGVDVSRPGLSSVDPRGLSPRQQARLFAELNRKHLGGTRRATPGARTLVVRARETGRHFISLVALRGGGDYTLVIRRL